MKIEPDKIIKMYNAFVEDEGVCIGGEDIHTKKEFIDYIGKKIGYRNIKNIIRERNATIKLELEKQLNELQRQTIRIQRQLDLIK